MTLEIRSIFMHIILIEKMKLDPHFTVLSNKLKFATVPYLTILIECQIYQVPLYIKFDTNSNISRLQMYIITFVFFYLTSEGIVMIVKLRCCLWYTILKNNKSINKPYYSSTPIWSFSYIFLIEYYFAIQTIYMKLHSRFIFILI